MATLFRLWLLASACWAGLVYWTWTSNNLGSWIGPALWPPAVVLLLGLALRWAFGAGISRRKV